MMLRAVKRLCLSYVDCLFFVSISYADQHHNYPMSRAQPLRADKVHLAETEFLHRVEISPQLREHQVWDAVRILSFDPRGGKTGQRFSELMASDALVDAALLIAASQSPPRRISTLHQTSQGWTCHLKFGGPERVRRVKGEHRDLAAALLIAIIKSLIVGKRPAITTE